MRENTDDPNAGLFGGDEESITEEEFLQKELYDKNPNRVTAVSDLLYEAIIKEVDAMDVPEEAKRKILFSLTANSVLDMMWDSDQDQAIDMSISFDLFLGVLLINTKYIGDLFKEHMNALMDMKPDEFSSEEEYEKALEAFSEEWWEIPQPLLGKRTPNDALREILSKYGLTE
jgi:hypothetical protein